MTLQELPPMERAAIEKVEALDSLIYMLRCAGKALSEGRFEPLVIERFGYGIEEVSKRASEDASELRGMMEDIFSAKADEANGSRRTQK